MKVHAVKTAPSEFVGKGLYGVAEAARIVGAHYNRVNRWLSPSESLIMRTFDHTERVIAFAELMELHFIKMFRDEGVSLQAIRKAATAAAAQFHTDYPFAVKRFDTDGKTIFATLVRKEKSEEMIQDLRRGQYVFTNIVRPFFRKLDYDTADISRYWPLSKNGRVVLDPQRQFGQPIDHETGVPTRALYQAVKAGKGQPAKKVADWFGVPVSAVRAAVKFETSLAA